MIVGGFTTIATDRPEVTGSMGFLTGLLASRLPDYRVSGITKAEVQVVPGYNTTVHKITRILYSSIPNCL